MICGLAEEGAQAIGADVDLIRTGSLYHDVGKLHAPNWFIENQKDGPNPDSLDDPQASARYSACGRRVETHEASTARPIADFIPDIGDSEDGAFLHKARERILRSMRAGSLPRTGTRSGDRRVDAGRWLRSGAAFSASHLDDQARDTVKGSSSPVSGTGSWQDTLSGARWNWWCVPSCRFGGGCGIDALPDPGRPSLSV